MKTYHDIATDGGSDVVGQVGDQMERLRARLSQVDHVVAITSGKGGVGKSMMTVLLATAAARLGLRVGILDADLNGTSQVRMTGVQRGAERTVDGILPAETADGVRVMSIDLFLRAEEPVRWKTTADGPSHSWRGLVEMGALREMLSDTDWGSLDLLLIDLPPGSDKLPGLVELVEDLDAAVLVTIPSQLSKYVVRKSVRNVLDAMDGRPVALIENMHGFECPTCGTHHDLFPTGDRDSLADINGLTRIGSIPFDPRIGEHVDEGAAFPVDESTPAGRAIMEAATALAGLLALDVERGPSKPANTNGHTS